MNDQTIKLTSHAPQAPLPEAIQSATLHDALQLTWSARCPSATAEEQQLFDSRARACKGLSEYLETLEKACEDNKIESLGLKIAGWFEPIFKLVELLTPAAAVAIQAYPNPGSLVLGGIVGVLQTADRMIQHQKMTVQVLARMGAKARILFDHEGYLYAEDKGVQTALLDVYGDIFAFCTGAFRLVEKKKKNKKDILLAQTKGLSKMFVSDFESQLGGIVKDFEQHMELLKDRISLRNSTWIREMLDKQDVEVKRSEAARDEVRDHFRRQDEFARVWKAQQDLLESRRAEQERQAEKTALLSWLCSDSFHTGYSEKCDDFLEGTGGWLLESRAYNEWKYNEHSDLLWISGIPGCGKSMLTAMVIDLDLQVETGSRVGLAYAFCRRDNDAKQSAALIFRALCKDVTDQLAGIDPVLQSQYRSSHPQDDLAIKNVRKIFSSVLSKFSTTFLVVDALDEFQDTEQRIKLVKELLALVRDQAVGTVKILVSSRQDATLDDLLGQYKHADPKEHNSEDLKAYIDHQFGVQGGHEGETGVNHDIRQACVDKAQGMFLWVKLVAASFTNQSLSPRQMLKKIEAVPSGLKSVYDAMLETMWSQTEEQRADALLVLLWVLHARRPLTGDELLEAVVDYSDFSWREEARESMQRSATRLVSKCANMVYIDREDNVRFCHVSLEDHFRSSHSNPPEPLLAFRRLETTVHERLAEICLKYMLLKDFECGPAKSRGALRTLVGEAPFLEYAADLWGWHVSQQSSKDIAGYVKALVRSRPRRELSMQIRLYQPSEETIHWLLVQKSNPLHILSAFGLKELAVGLPNIANMVMEEDAARFTPLDYALLGSHAEMCLFLIQSDKTQHEAILEPEKRLAAIHRGAALGWTQVLKHLLAEDQSLVDSQIDPQGSTPLVIACSTGKTAAAEVLLEHGADLNLRDGEGDTPLIVSTLNRHADVTDLLLDRGAEPHCADASGHTPLHYAALHGDVDIAAALISKQADLLVSETIDLKLTPVHYAAASGAVEILVAMYERRSDLNTKTKSGATPLHMAATHNMHGAVNALISFEVPKDDVDEDGQTALFIAAQEQHWQIVESLLDVGCAVDVEDTNGQTAVHAAAIGGSEKVLGCLLKRRPTESWSKVLNHKNHSGESPLHIAIREGNYKMAKELLARGADASLPGLIGASPLHYVAHCGPATLVAPIIRSLDNVNPRDRNGDTPLHYAARARNFGFVKELVSACSLFALALDAHIVNNHRTSPLMIALDKGDQSIAEILVEHDQTSLADTDGNYPIHLAAWNGYDAVVMKLLERPGNTKQGYFGRTPLACAALRGHLTTVQLLGTVSREVLDVPDNARATPLMRAIQNEHLQIADYLIRIQANVKVTDKFGRTLLHLAADIKNLPIMRQLLALECDAEALTQYGESVFHRAVCSGSIDIVDELLDRGINHVKMPTALGDYCTSIAASSGNLPMLRKLDELEVQYSIPNLLGRNAAGAAAGSGYWEILFFLRDHGEDLEFRDLAGTGPMRFAAVEGYPLTVATLVTLADHSGLALDSEYLATTLLAAVKEYRPDSAVILLKAGADPTVLDHSGLNAIDYASQYLPLQAHMLRVGHFHNPNTREAAGKKVMETIKTSCEFIISTDVTQSVPGIYARNVKVLHLFDALRRVQDYQSARICAMELLWHSDSELIWASYACSLCGAENFEGDRFSCKSCHSSLVLCGKCHEDYLESGRQPPESFLAISALENAMRPVRLNIDDEYSLTGVWYAMDYFVDGSRWMSEISELYELWEQRWNSDQKYRELKRPGETLLKMVKQAGQYWMKANCGRVNAEDRLHFAKLNEKFGAFRRDKEFLHFPCRNHEFYVITDEDRTAMQKAGKDLDSETGKVTKAWAKAVLAKYSTISVAERMAASDTGFHKHAATDSDVSPEQGFQSGGTTKRSLTWVQNPTLKAESDDLLSVMVARNSNLLSDNDARGKVELRQVRRAKTLPLETPRINWRGKLDIQLKDSSVIAAATDVLEAQRGHSRSEGPSATGFDQTTHRTLSVSVVPQRAGHSQESSVLTGEPKCDDSATAATESGGGMIFPLTLIAEPESIVEAEDGLPAAESGAEPDEDPVAVIAAASGRRTEGNDETSSGDPSEKILEFAYLQLHPNRDTQRDIDLWKFAVKITQVMDPKFTGKLMRYLRERGVIIA